MGIASFFNLLAEGWHRYYNDGINFHIDGKNYFKLMLSAMRANFKCIIR